MRDLPWRQSRDPWGILVAEVMAQQTQVDRVVQRWGQFLGRFPTPAACAAAPLGDVLREWQGLGYPRRARHLHESANRVVELGAFPSTLGGLLALPGVGQYTARAVLAFAFESPAAVVDTNIARVLARTVGERLTAKRAQALADELCPPEDSWVWNQVIMDLGAVLCRPAPRCAECPIEQQCVWTASGQPDPDPAIGTAGVSGKQARFEGSDRQARGRLMAGLVVGSLSVVEAVAVMQVDAERAERLVTALVAEGLVVGDGESLRLP
jgi:A/G-specific adenine glycosylase